MVWGTGWRHGLSLTDVVLSTVFSATTLHGITVDFHRYFTHGSFKAKRPLRIALAVAVSTAIEGPVTRWVADHRRHPADSDAEGDPHSPWRYGNDVRSPCNAPMSAGGWMSSRPISSGSPRTCSLTVMSPGWTGRFRSWGNRPFVTRDRAVNLRWPAAISVGESWHNLHHADPTCARSGVDRGQIDSSTVTIRAFERLGWAHNVRWPKAERLDARRATAA